LGYPIPPRRSSFPTHPRGFPPVAVPQGFHLGFILSCAFRPSRVSRATTGPAEPDAFLGLSVLIATSTCGVHACELPKPASFRPRRFARPRRLAPPLASRVCFTPLPRPGFAPSRGLSLPRKPCPVSRTAALMPVDDRRLCSCPQASAVRPDFRALLFRESAVAPAAVKPPMLRAPPGLCPPPGVPRASQATLSRHPPSTAFDRTCRPVGALDVLPMPGCRCLATSHLTRSRLLA